MRALQISDAIRLVQHKFSDHPVFGVVFNNKKGGLTKEAPDMTIALFAVFIDLAMSLTTSSCNFDAQTIPVTFEQIVNLVCSIYKTTCTTLETNNTT